MMLRLFEAICVVALLGTGYCAQKAIWFKPDVVKDLPKDAKSVKNNPGTWRKHYRTHFIFIGGK